MSVVVRLRSLVWFVVVALATGVLSPSPSQAGTSPVGAGDAVQTVVLLTGDAVRVSTLQGRPHVAVVAAQRSDVTGQFDLTQVDGHQYVFPAEVRPFLGGVLDPSLFDVTALAGSARGRTPVQLTMKPGSTPSVPGLTVTSQSGTSASGYLDASGTDALRSALVRAWKRAVRPGARSATTLFGGVTHLATTLPRATPAASAFPQVTLILKVLDAKGQPVSGGFVGLINTDDGRKYVGFAFVRNGEARVSVPYGNYSGITDVGDFDPATGFVDRIVPIADFAVTANRQTVTFDARTARVQPTVSVPRAAKVTTKSAEFDRMSRSVGSLGFSFAFGADSVYSVAPVDEVAVGSAEWVTGYTLQGSGAGGDYRYDVSFRDDNVVPRDQDRTVQPYQLATIDARYYSDRSREGEFVRIPVYPFQFFVFGFFDPISLPQARTEYVTGGSGVLWGDELLAAPTEDNPFGGFVLDALRSHPYGSSDQADWLRGPLAPAPEERVSADGFYFCPACRTSSRLAIGLAPIADSEPGHIGFVSDPASGPAASFSLSRDGVVIASGDDRTGANVAVAPDDATYALHLSVNRAADETLTSTATDTDLVFHSSATSGVGLPSGWYCGIGTGQNCTVLPVLRAVVPLPTDLSNRLPVGDTTFVMTVRRFAGAGPATITDATVSTRTGQGGFVPAAVIRLSNGRYQVTLSNAPQDAGLPVTLRLSAEDDAGNSITQTTRAAYLIATS